MHFTYKARDKQGHQVNGDIEASDEAGAVASLREKDLYVSTITASNSKSLVPNVFNRVSVKDKILFSQQLGVMIKSGLSVVEALEALKGEQNNKKFAKVINDVISDVKGGTPLSASFEKHPEIFDPVYTNTIASGEKSGKLDDVLESLTLQLEKDYALTSKLKGAMIYPIVVVFIMIVVVVVILVYIIPQLKIIFEDSGAPLPVITRAVIALSDFVRKDIIFIILGIIAIAFGVRFASKTDKGRHIMDRIKIKLPVFGNLNVKTYMARFARTFSGLNKSGLPLLEIFRTSKLVINNVIYQDEIDKMMKKVEVGEPVSKVIKDCKYFPSMVGNLVSVGEKSGSLDVVFDTIANFFDKEVDGITNNLSTLLEPVLMVFMAVGVVFIILSVLQPIYGLMNVI